MLNPDRSPRVQIDFFRMKHRSSTLDGKNAVDLENRAIIWSLGRCTHALHSQLSHNKPLEFRERLAREPEGRDWVRVKYTIGRQEGMLKIKWRRVLRLRKRARGIDGTFPIYLVASHESTFSYFFQLSCHSRTFLFLSIQKFTEFMSVHLLNFFCVSLLLYYLLKFIIYFVVCFLSCVLSCNLRGSRFKTCDKDIYM